MRNICTTTFLLAASLTIGCAGGSQSPVAPESFSVPVYVHSMPAGQTLDAAAHGGVAKNSRTHLSGGEEVPARPTQAQGQAIFQLSADGSALSYKLNIANIENVTQAHIHRAAAGINGPIVVWLYPSAPPATLIPGRSQGTLAEGVITDASLVGPMAGQTLAALLNEIEAENTYVNVHTSQFPGGEIRGQID
jgi:hypothetical protein